MSFLLIAVIIGAIFAYIATQNTNGVPLNLGPYSWSSLPLYIVVLGSLLVGLLVGWLMSMIDGIASAFTLHGKDKKIRQAESEVELLRERIHKLEIENKELQLRNEKKNTVLNNERFEDSGDGILGKLKHSVNR